MAFDPEAELVRLGKEGFRAAYLHLLTGGTVTASNDEIRRILARLDREDAAAQHAETVALAVKGNTLAQDGKFWARVSAIVGFLGLLIGLAALFFDD